MKYMVFSDVHGKAEKLGSMESDLPDGEFAYICLGDVCGKNVGKTKEVIDWLREKKAVTVYGDREQAALNPGYWNAEIGKARTEKDRTGLLEAKRISEDLNENLPPEYKEYLKGLVAAGKSIEFEGVVLVHNPLGELKRIRSKEDARKYLDSTTARLTLAGHTHVPSVYEIKTDGEIVEMTFSENAVIDLSDKKSRFIVNPGSLSHMKYRGGQRDYAINSYGILDTDKETFEIRFL